MESAEVVAKTCSKCGGGFASKNHAWCRKCRSEHESTRQATQEEMAAARWWAAGVRAFREEIARTFARRPGYTVECAAIAQYIMDFPAPKKDPSTEAEG